MFDFSVLKKSMARWTGLEPATPCVTGRYSNQLNYHRMRERNISRLIFNFRLKSYEISFFCMVGTTGLEPVTSTL